MQIRLLPGMLVLMIVLQCGVSASWARGGAPPVIQREYTVFVELQPPYGSNRAKLQKQLKAEGYESHPEGERELALVLTEAQIGKLFLARIQYRKVEGSAAPGMREVPYLEGARIPARFGKLVRWVYFDPQR